ncbi:MAG: glycosyltransferase family 4 protein, partial [Endomicrobiia bacterium]
MDPSHKLLKLAKKFKDVIVTGYVEDIRDYISIATVNVCPMISGSGIKNKILESMSMGIPSVITTIAGEGMPEIKDYENVLISDDAQDFIQKIVMLIKDKNLYNKIVINGRKLIEERYNWRSVTERFLDIFYK